MSNDAIATAKAGILALRAAVADVIKAVQDRAADKTRLADGHEKQAARLVTLRAQLARVTTDSEHGKMDTLATGINTDLTAMNGAVTANDPVQITAKLVDMAAMPDRLDALAAEIDAALTRVLTATLSSTGTSDEQKATLVKLGKANPEALTKATAVLGQFQGSLGDVTVDRAYLDAKALEITHTAALQETRKSEKDASVIRQFR
jgi:hypothetical protein